MEGCDYQNDLITILTAITFDRFGVIRDYLYERDENGEYFFVNKNITKILEYHENIARKSIFKNTRQKITFSLQSEQIAGQNARFMR